MTWNLRLVNMADPACPDDPWIEIREVFYDQVGKPLGHTSAPISGETKEEVATYLQWALEALDKPILTFKE
jgi:tetrahydromethanopterin S-methyltransferase subunit H